VGDELHFGNGLLALAKAISEKDVEIFQIY
jgi:hypothetical protein